MAILSRMSRLLVCDMHALLERLEEPELVLKQSVRDMEEALQAQILRLQRQCAQLRRLRCRRDDLLSRMDALNEQLDASIGAGRMDTSRSIVRRKLENQAQSGLLERQIADLDQRQKELREGIERRGAELEGLREKAQLLCETHETDAGDTITPDGGSWVSGQDVEAALLHEIARRSGS